MTENKKLVNRVAEESTLSGRPHLGTHPTEGDKTFKKIYNNARRQYGTRGDRYNYGAYSNGDSDAD